LTSSHKSNHPNRNPNDRTYGVFQETAIVSVEMTREVIARTPPPAFLFPNQQCQRPELPQEPHRLTPVVGGGGVLVASNSEVNQTFLTFFNRQRPKSSATSKPCQITRTQIPGRRRVRRRAVSNRPNSPCQPIFPIPEKPDQSPAPENRAAETSRRPPQWFGAFRLEAEVYSPRKPTSTDCFKLFLDLRPKSQFYQNALSILRRLSPQIILTNPCRRGVTN
jgi:hypothetical protein